MRLTRVTHDQGNIRACSMRIWHHRDRWALVKFDGRVGPRTAEQRKCALHVLHTTTATTKCVKSVRMMIVMVALLKFDGRVFPKNSGQWLCALHVIHTTAATSEQAKCVFSVSEIVGRCVNSTAESCRVALSSGNAPYTCNTLPPQRPLISNACLSLYGSLRVVDILW